MKILIDMNLSPDWVAAFLGHGIEATHWSSIGDPRAEDSLIMSYALANDYIVFTHDLDFGTLLALTHDTGPSVIQIRTQNILSLNLIATVASVVTQYTLQLTTGALIVIDESRARVRILPLQKR